MSKGGCERDAAETRMRCQGGSACAFVETARRADRGLRGAGNRNITQEGISYQLLSCDRYIREPLGGGCKWLCYRLFSYRDPFFGIGGTEDHLSTWRRVMVLAVGNLAEIDGGFKHPAVQLLPEV